MNVGYLGPLRDYSGYGEANRHFVAALDEGGVHIVPTLVNYVSERADFGALGKRVDDLISTHAGDPYRIKILHTTPDEYHRFIEPGKYHIGHFFWETDRIPRDWARAFEQVDEIWTGSEANRHALLSTGVDKPVYIFPQPTETDREWPAPYENPDFAQRFMFYSIFEWTDRKNPLALLSAYLKEFQASEPVGLLVKTYFRNFTLRNKNMIRDQIRALKDSLDLPAYPPIYLYLELMDRRQVMRIHSTGDCFVSAHRGEGWGVPQVEAMLAGNPIISTGYSGVHEYLKHGKSALMPGYEMQPVHGMEHSNRWYTPDQKWAEIDPVQLRAAMRSVYKAPKTAEKIGRAGRALAVKQFSFERVGKMMAERLAAIEEGLNESR
jgi:glycosyltransferase involved in cell wall biosynthesis